VQALLAHVQAWSELRRAITEIEGLLQVEPALTPTSPGN
jgi:hypothetical protein